MEKRIEYKLGDNVMQIIQNALYETNRVDFAGPDPSKDVTVKTGIGGMSKLHKAIEEMTTKSGLVINATEIGAITGTSTIEKFPITSYTIPYLANVKFSVDPVYDPMEEDVNNPYIDGFRQSSYNYTIELVNEEENVSIEIVCVGKLPVFKEELLKLIRESKIADKYEVLPTRLQKYIMNCLKNLE